MPPSDQEFGVLDQRVRGLENDMCEVKKDVKSILRHMDEEKGAREASAKSQANNYARVELTWTKVMALGAVIGSIIEGAPMLVHFFVH